VSASKRRGSHLLYNLKRFANFIGTFVRHPYGIVGIIIIVVFAFIAVFPQLFTSYDPVYQTYLGGPYSAPAWLKSIPSQLGGDPNLSSDENPILNSGFENSTLTAWNFTSMDQFTHTSIGYLGNFSDHVGVLDVGFRRGEVGVAYGNVTVSISQLFYYPYSGAPFNFLARLAFLLNGSVTTNSYLAQVANESDPLQWSMPTYNVTESVLDVPVKMTMYVECLATKVSLPIWPLREQYIYTPKQFLGMTNDGVYVTTSSTIALVGSNETTTTGSTFGLWVDTDQTNEPINSWTYAIGNYVSKHYGSSNSTISVFFPKTAIPGWYKVALNVTFVDTNSVRPVGSEVFLDTVNFRTLGTSWGIMGLDQEGRDLWSQLMYGARISLYVGVLSAAVAVGIGLVVGLMAGYLGKVVDEILMRICDVILVLPGLPLLIVLVAVLGTNVNNLIILLGALGWPGFARLVRSQVITLRERPFVEAAKAVGAGKTHIMVRHILPNVMGLVYVTLAQTVPGNIVAEASLGFLGFTDPTRMSWGLMLNNLNAFAAFRDWWWVIPPGLCIAAIAIAFVMFGYALDETLNPRIRLRR
jgi:peptide/nickel transport system permease protein